MDESERNNAVIKDDVFIFACLRLCLDATFSFCKQNGQHGRDTTTIAEALAFTFKDVFGKNIVKIESSSFVSDVFSFHFRNQWDLSFRCLTFLDLRPDIANRERSRSFTIAGLNVKPLISVVSFSR